MKAQQATHDDGCNGTVSKRQECLIWDLQIPGQRVVQQKVDFSDTCEHHI